jgi:hypothetical protein
MKIRPFLLFVLTLLVVCVPLRAAQAPKLETLLGEYKKARSDVLGKLNEAYAQQADALAKQYLTIPNLDGADRAQRFAKRLRELDLNHAPEGPAANTPATDPLSVLQSDYARAREENLHNAYVFYASTAANLRRELLRTKDQAGADVLTTFLEKIKPPDGTKHASATTPAQASPAKSRTVSAK